VKKLITFSLALLPYITTACAVCGGSASNQNMAVQPQFYKHFAGIQYQYRSFNSTHPAKDGAASHSNEQYNTIQVWGRYNIGNRLRLFGFIPYISNIHEENGKKTNCSGLGDISFLGNIRVLSLKQPSNNWQHDLQIGGGLKLPTGRYNKESILRGDNLPNMQPGTKSWDVTANTIYTARYKSLGGTIDASYTIVTPNTDDYKFGNRLSTGVSVFYWWQTKKCIILPQSGVRLDATAGDYEYYSRNIKSDMTGGQQLYISVGIQAYYKFSGIQFLYYIPVYQHYADGLVKSKARAETGIYFLF
jgi:hypothetical protein